MSASAKVALVTGAGTGVGKAVAIALAKAGYNLVLAGRRKEPLDETAAQINAAGAQSLAVPTDVSKREDIVALFSKVKSTFGRLDLLFNNAGIGAPAVPLEDLPFETWQNVVDGIPAGAYVNSVKEDPVQKGLLYAATELRVYVSFDDGAQWQPLQNNMPVTSVRDIIVHGDDLAIATHGRGFWVMDHAEALRQIAARGQQIAGATAYLFQPGETYAIRAGGMNGTPMPMEEPQLQNPPAGVVAYYWLKNAPAQPLKLELVDSRGAVRACAASDTPVRPPDTDTLNVEAKWMQPAQPPSAAAGMHRYALGAAAGRGGFGRGAAAPPAPDACHPAGAAPQQADGGRGGRGGRGAGGGGGGGFGRGAAGLQPGEYTVRLTVDGQTYTQHVTVKPDPRGAPAGPAAPTGGEEDK